MEFDNKSSWISFTVQAYSWRLMGDWLIVGSLSNNNSEVSKNDKRNRFRLAQQQLCMCIMLFFVHFFAVTARLQRESA